MISKLRPGDSRRAFLLRTAAAGSWSCLGARLGATVLAAAGEAGSARKPPPFFAFCMDTHDAQKRTLAQQAELLKELGYDGAGHLWLDQLEERLRTLDAVGLKLFQVYLRVNLGPEGSAFDGRLKALLPLLRGRDTMLALLLTGGKPSDPAGDPRAVALVREIAALAEPTATRLALYPHANDWLERTQDAVRVARQVAHPLVGVMFNLCHWLKVDDEVNLSSVLEAALPYLQAVSLHGADTAAEIHAGKGQWIQPLGSGSFEVAKLLRGLKTIGYRGPIGLQCYGLDGDARDHLAKSMAAWRKLSASMLVAP